MHESIPRSCCDLSLLNQLHPQPVGPLSTARQGSPKKWGRKPIAARAICYDGENLNSEHILHIQKDIRRFNKDTGEGVTLKKLRNSLSSKFNTEVRNSLLRKVLLRLGYKWQKCTKKGKLKQCASRQQRTRQFLKEYAAALKQQNIDNTHVIIFMDESYIHQRHSANYTCCSSSDNVVHTGSGEGLRLIIVHAISKDGLLFKEGEQRKPGTTTRLSKSVSLVLSEK